MREATKGETEQEQEIRFRARPASGRTSTPDRFLGKERSIALSSSGMMELSVTWMSAGPDLGRALRDVREAHPKLLPESRQARVELSVHGGAVGWNHAAVGRET